MLAASLPPALRASRVAPIEALRGESHRESVPTKMPRRYNRGMKHIMLLVAIVMAFCAASPLPLLAHQDKPVDVAGKWALTVETAGGTGSPTIQLTQDGETLAGTYSSQVFGEQKLTGTIKGAAIVLSVGLAAGLSLAWFSGHLVESQLIGITSRDPVPYGVAALLMIAVVALASISPAVAATRVDAIEVIRSD